MEDVRTIEFKSFGKTEVGREITRNNDIIVVNCRNPYGSHNLVLVAEDEEKNLFAICHGNTNCAYWLFKNADAKTYKKVRRWLASRGKFINIPMFMSGESLVEFHRCERTSITFCGTEYRGIFLDNRFISEELTLKRHFDDGIGQEEDNDFASPGTPYDIYEDVESGLIDSKAKRGPSTTALYLRLPMPAEFTVIDVISSDNTGTIIDDLDNDSIIVVTDEMTECIIVKCDNLTNASSVYAYCIDKKKYKDSLIAADKGQLLQWTEPECHSLKYTFIKRGDVK